MNNKLEILRKKLIYRAGHRGTKEMDILLGTFVNKYINNLDENLLYELDKFLDYEDEAILNFYQYSVHLFAESFLWFLYLFQIFSSNH